ncbi:protein translocase SEC61 complex subunit gamma [archaeon]|jgi:protein transport protein SEC61 subunit gamma and related proteins|nr:protein translocase SEC61 complex subunit gamma [archaeon]MBT6698444.1 protein translocase SEC61 complex subunit gamma [archaeon]
MEASDSNKKSLKLQIKSFWKQTIRVLRITKRPNREEYIAAMKITGLGIALIGAVGFILFMIKQLIL